MDYETQTTAQNAPAKAPVSLHTMFNLPTQQHDELLLPKEEECCNKATD